MEGKVALITGAAKGLGRVFAERLLQRGASVCITDINTDVGQTAAEALQKSHSSDRVSFMACDVTKKANIEASLQHTIQQFGRLDILCNNAGIMHEKNWEQMLAINLTAVIQGTMLGIDYMKPPSGQGGVIINTASSAGVLPMGFGPVYSAAKHGVVAFTRSLGGFSRKTHDVRINCLCPSFARTDILQMEEAGQLLGSLDTTRKLIKDVGLVETSEVGDAFMTLLDNPRASGRAMVVTPLGSKILAMPRTLEELYECSTDMELKSSKRH